MSRSLFLSLTVDTQLITSLYGSTHEDAPFYWPNTEMIGVLRQLKSTKVCFVVCDNGFSHIFYNCSNVEEYFLGTIKHLICRKKCSKYFENRLTNKNVLVKNIFE